MTARTPVLVREFVGDTIHADRDTLAHMLGVAANTIRKYCRPVRYDPATRRALYDGHAVQDEMDRRGVEARHDMQGKPKPRRPFWAGRRPHRRTTPA
ncbi:hypothetical protein [Catenuloplanes japonicus]|uniref:hypothetical protein n=1 Tax=Catenuloplanes japonicus TaxID=33876 RepID=UPI000524090B|nr:hypothetical protein [Catenuloplanes japonicus]